MNIFLQGMRRSGTTIVFDLLWQDTRLDCYYEPLAKAALPTHGGGSGMTGIDYFAKIRAIRQSYKAKDPTLENVDQLHYGAPDHPELEFIADPPPYIKGYIRHMTEQAEHTAIKFTRMYNKVHVLHEIDPTAKFVLLVKDPRATVASYLFGKGQKNKELYTPSGRFFARKSAYEAWSFRAFSDHLLQTPEYSHLQGCEDFVRVLVVWKHTFERAYHAGRKHFGDRFMLVRNEDLQRNPAATLDNLYGHFGLSVPHAVVDWAVRNVRAPALPFEAESDNWYRAFERVRMLDALALAGYPDCTRRPKGPVVSAISRLARQFRSVP